MYIVARKFPRDSENSPIWGPNIGQRNSSCKVCKRWFTLNAQQLGNSNWE